ncbi:DUF5317 domain-containing protein [Neobacillus terrae]|uniref:DUF5317 domain-containing protein n=1 Tax=Neobacillus terrae TaxID=3034837 RepID=UPI00140B1276|nr:DUF5317 domain-containing protein [Neobacillus terrae]NHM30034.1 DUF5317 domain-containing protein [Neobacillus terrae]
MVFDGIIFSIIIGFFRKGSLRSFATLKFKWGWMFPLLLAIELLVFLFQNDSKLLGQTSGAIYMLVYVVGLIFLMANRKKEGFTVIFIGVFLNFLVMIVNGGRMPVSGEAATVLSPEYIQYLKNGHYAKHQLMTESAHLKFLGDIIPLSKPYPRTQIISIGDVVMNIGVFLFIQNIMVGRRNENNNTRKSLSLKGGEAK